MAGRDPAFAASPSSPSSGSRPSGLQSGVGCSAINVGDGLFIDEDGTLFPITNWFDEDGDECPREDAVVCVAGSDGRWFSIVIADFTEIGARA